jgi:hypothetical protein
VRINFALDTRLGYELPNVREGCPVAYRRAGLLRNPLRKFLSVCQFSYFRFSGGFRHSDHGDDYQVLVVAIGDSPLRGLHGTRFVLFWKLKITRDLSLVGREQF